MVGAFYYLRIVKIMFFDDARPAFVTAPLKTRLVYMVAALLMIVFSLSWVGEPVVRAAAAAAKTLM